MGSNRELTYSRASKRRFTISRRLPRAGTTPLLPTKISGLPLSFGKSSHKSSRERVVGHLQLPSRRTSQTTTPAVIQELLVKLRTDANNIFETEDIREHRCEQTVIPRSFDSKHSFSMISEQFYIKTAYWGRHHMYSYVLDPQTGVWWKTVDHTITEVNTNAGQACIFISLASPGDRGDRAG